MTVWPTYAFFRSTIVNRDGALFASPVDGDRLTHRQAHRAAVPSAA